MYRGPELLFKVVERDSRFDVWQAGARRIEPWRESGLYGTVEDCWEFIEAKEGGSGFLFHFPIKA